MAKRKVVIIDDDKDFLDELKEALNNEAYEVFTLEDSLSAKEEIEKIKPHLIVVDLKMPKKTGFQVAQELSKSPTASRVPVIAMTGFFTEAEHSLLMNMCGISHCLKKPFSPAQVMAKIEEVFLKESEILKNGQSK